MLIIKYGSFLELVKQAAKWRAGHAISFGGAETKMFKAPLVVVDPVDRNRNVGAAISAESFYRFVKASKEFVDRPSVNSFFKKKSKASFVERYIERVREARDALVPSKLQEA